MHPAYIRAELQIAGTTQAAIARQLTVSRTAIGLVIDGKSRSRRIEKAISDATGVSLHTLWPQWYPSEPKRRAA